MLDISRERTCNRARLPSMKGKELTTPQCVGGRGLEQIGDACLHVVGISTNPKLDPDFVFVADGMEVWLSMMLVLESVRPLRVHFFKNYSPELQAFPEGLVELAQANLPLLLQADVSSHVPPALLLHIAQCYLVCCPLFNTDVRCATCFSPVIFSIWCRLRRGKA